jgi:hypothetical protein
MAYSDEWLKAFHASRTNQESRTVDPVPRRRLGDVAPCEHSTTWKPWAQMTAEERRKALAEREEKP